MKLSDSAPRHILRLADEKPTPEGRGKYCRFCGSLIPYESAYCPNCGVPQETSVTMPEAATRRGRVAEAVTKKGRRIRLALFLLSLAVFVVTFLLGSTASLSTREAEVIVKEFTDVFGMNPSATLILTNNLILYLLSFIPALGLAFMAFAFYNSGLVLSALSIVAGAPSQALILAFMTLTLPWTWMELIAYSLASSEGIMAILALIGRTLRNEAKILLTILGVSVTLLIVGAVVEELAINIAMAS